MIPVYRDWDEETNEKYIPKMVYTTILNPNVEKDIILHKNRKAYMTCVSGNVLVEALVENKIKSYSLKFDEEVDFINLLIIENNIPIKIKNLSNLQSIVLNCPTPAWHPEDQDTFKFKTWDDYRKWEG